VDRNQELFDQVSGLLSGTDIELVDVETVGTSRGMVIRILVDRPAGVSVEDCARVSRAVGDHFEAGKVIAGRYVLEVSSPGIDRPLRRPEDFSRFIGETAEVLTHERIEGRHTHRGTLKGFDPEADAVMLETEENGPVVIPRGAIRKARLKRDPWAGVRNPRSEKK
jgi:ribosome maturation factor RimP